MQMKPHCSFSAIRCLPVPPLPGRECENHKKWGGKVCVWVVVEPGIGWYWYGQSYTEGVCVSPRSFTAPQTTKTRLLQGDEARGVGRADAGLAVLDGPV